ncbi:MAG TPA: ribonuclease P protein component [Terracidiphilus sp.]|nr:ribonuclease P protein component [Terracidiphilus sp.]
MNNFLPADPVPTDLVQTLVQTAETRAAGRHTLVPFRLRSHGDFQRAYAASRKRQSATMSWFVAPQSEPEAAARVGLTAGKVLGKAHDRNRIKRRMREALRRHVELLPRGFDLILHPRRGVLTMDFRKLEAEVVRILGEARAEAERTKSAAGPGKA